MSDIDDVEFTAFFRATEPRLRHALIGLCGTDATHDAVAEALTYAWEHWARVRAMENPAGYLYQVAKSRTKARRSPPTFPKPEPGRLPDVEPRLSWALSQLAERQRVVVFLIEGCAWTVPEVAAMLELSSSSVRNHLSRGMKRLQTLLGVHDAN